MKVPFTKMQGLGNDFVLVDVRDRALPDPEGFAKTFGDRRFGIGADQILLAGRSADADLRMEIYNRDGSRVEMCGNGIRCFAKYVRDRDLPEGRGKDVLRVETLAGIIRPRLLPDGRVEVDMGAPRLEGPEIPVALEGRVVDRAVRVGGAERRMTAVSMGNPHAVFFVGDLATVPLDAWGPAIETDPLFPRRTNVEFVQVTGEALLTRVWERGAGATLACGTGACAVGVAAALTGRAGRTSTVRLPGGELAIEWRESDGHVYMTGPAAEVFRGEVEWGEG